MSVILDLQKREEQAKQMNLSEKELDKAEKKRRDEMKRELEKVKKRRMVKTSNSYQLLCASRIMLCVYL